MLPYEAQIPDTYLFAHSSLQEDLRPTTVCFYFQVLFFSLQLEKEKADSLQDLHLDMQWVLQFSLKDTVQMG